MTQKARHLRMTEADKARKVAKQRERRAEMTLAERRPTWSNRKPKASRQVRSLLAGRDYEEVYEEILQAQHGVCAICSRVPGQRRLHIDHDHNTDIIRGLLCFSCNSKLGFVEKWLNEIHEYLTKENIEC